MGEFEQWNPNKNNMESDETFLADTMRLNGAPGGPSIFNAVLGNKLLYQLSTMVTALARMLTNKGYTISDADLNNLIAALQNIETLADFPAGFGTVSGWQKLPSGFILQYGHATLLTPGQWRFVTFPIAFLISYQIALCPLLTSSAYGQYDNQYSMNTQGTTLQGFNLWYNKGGSPSSCSYIAVGH